MIYTRALRYQLPLVRGEDVLAVQLRLRQLGSTGMSQPDGKFGHLSDAAVREFQQAHGLKVDGIVGPLTWNTLFADPPTVPAAPGATSTLPSTALERVTAVLDELKQPHQFQTSVSWQLTNAGVAIAGAVPETTGGEPQTVRQVWQQYSTPIQDWAASFGIPVELIVATICTETRGDQKAVREEPGFVSDDATPGKVSPGLMQTLISTARQTLGDPTINRAWLLEPGNSIRAGAAYIASQWKGTHLDPPKVACAYNAGSVIFNDTAGNRWKMRQFPIGSAEHADRFVKWFNDCFVMFERDRVSANLSFYDVLRA